jgi:hypothetical protein
MVTIERFIEFCYAFQGVTDYPHFDRKAFKNKRDFVTFMREIGKSILYLTITASLALFFEAQSTQPQYMGHFQCQLYGNGL